jgi:hypothetical protein
LHFKFVSHMDEVLKIALTKPLKVEPKKRSGRTPVDMPPAMPPPAN